MSLGIFSRSWHIDGAKIRYDYLELSSKQMTNTLILLQESISDRDIKCIFIEPKSFEKSLAFVEFCCYVFVPQVITRTVHAQHSQSERDPNTPYSKSRAKGMIDFQARQIHIRYSFQKSWDSVASSPLRPQSLVHGDASIRLILQHRS